MGQSYPRGGEVLELSLANVDGYLRSHGHVEGVQAVEYAELGGGISNTVLKAILPADCFVVKQSLPKLRVADEWFFDRRRIFVERDCMATLQGLLPAGSVPSVRFSDDSNYVLGMTCAPPGGEIWKDVLLAGRVDGETAERAGRLLAMIHCESYQRPELVARFRDQSFFVQGRIDPYHRTAAARHPDLRSVIDAEIDRMMATRLVLVHGDYSPKNIAVYPGGLLVLDFEVAHYGDPAFDIAFCMTHLVLKAAHFGPQHAGYLECARRFWRAYQDTEGGTFDEGLDSAVIAELGCLLLARIDGKSKIEYIKDEPTKELVRRLARGLLLNPPRNPLAAVDWLEIAMSPAAT